MNTITSAVFGVVFLGLSFAATFLMYYLWGFPFDKSTRTSAAPKSLMRLHRLIGYSYVALYLLMMTQMVPRMWQYQVELPPRTVAHLILGYLIGAILLIKIAIMRFFRHLEEWMPYLGTLLCLCTVLLLGLSLPSAFHESTLAANAVGGGVYSSANRQRVALLLPEANLPAGAPLAELSTEASLSAGRKVLLEKCVRCHDLKTILDRPRTPSDWVAVVDRMAQKPALFTPITQRDQWQASAYLIAITPGLQQSVERRREAVQTQQQSQKAVTQGLNKPEAAVDLTTAQATFQRICSQCHASNKVDQSPPHTVPEVQALIQRMSDNGMQAGRSEVEAIQAYLTKTYVKSH